MWFFGKVDLGKSVSSLQGRADKLKEQKKALSADVLQAIETRNTVIATIGQEIRELQSIDAF